MDEVEFHAPPRESKSKRWLSFHPFSGIQYIYVYVYIYIYIYIYISISCLVFHGKIHVWATCQSSAVARQLAQELSGEREKSSKRVRLSGLQNLGGK